MRQTAKRVGELLIIRGLLKPWQLERALEEQRATKEFLGALLVRKGWITESALLDALAEQFGIPHIRLDVEEIDWTLVSRFSSSLLMEHHCMPIRMDRQVVMVAITNPLDAWAVSELEKTAGSKTLQLVLASTQEVQAALKRFYQEAMKALDRRHPEPST